MTHSSTMEMGSLSVSYQGPVRSGRGISYAYQIAFDPDLTNERDETIAAQNSNGIYQAFQSLMTAFAEHAPNLSAQVQTFVGLLQECELRNQTPCFPVSSEDLKRASDFNSDLGNALSAIHNHFLETAATQHQRVSER